MEKAEETKPALLKAFDQSEKKSVAEVCRIVGVTPSTFYFHFYKDSEFRREILTRRHQQLAEQIATV
jgi:AcrR family transcriptional regulator